MIAVLRAGPAGTRFGWELERVRRIVVVPVEVIVARAPRADAPEPLRVQNAGERRDDMPSHVHPAPGDYQRLPLVAESEPCRLCHQWRQPASLAPVEFVAADHARH